MDLIARKHTPGDLAVDTSSAPTLVPQHLVLGNRPDRVRRLRALFGQPRDDRRESMTEACRLMFLPM